MSSGVAPTMSQVRDSHDGIAPAQPPSVNKVYAIQPKNGVTTTPFNGAQYQIEFEYPNYLGKVIDSVIQFDLTFTTTGAVAGTFQHLPTTFFFDRIEFIYANNVVESLGSDQIHLETLQFCTDQEYRTMTIPVHIAEDGDFATAEALGGASPALQTMSKTVYLPLWSSWINTMQPYLKGFRDSFRIRCYTTRSIEVALVTIPDLSVSMTSCVLWATEAQLSDTATRQLDNAHRKGVVYRSVLRNKWQKIDTLTDSSEYNQVIQSFTSDSAGVAIYARPNSTTPADFLTRQPLKYVALLDSTGSELTQRLPDGLIKYFVVPETVPFTSLVTDPTKDSYYVFPLCNSLLDVLESGKVGGGLKFSGNERFTTVLPAGAGSVSNLVITALSWDYCVVNVKNGSAVVERHG
jgi:hypothetical protein